LGRKRRAFFAPGLGIAGAVVYLVAGLEAPYSSLIVVLMFIGIFVDSRRSKEWAAMGRRMQIALSVLWPVIIVGFLWMAIGRTPFRITVSETELAFKPGRDVLLRNFDRETLLRRDMTATRLRVRDSDQAQWRFRSGTDPKKVITLDAHATFRDQDGRRWDGEELAQDIVQWADVPYEEKLVRDFMEETQSPEPDLKDVPMPQE
jgi:hypothetical protein